MRGQAVPRGYGLPPTGADGGRPGYGAVTAVPSAGGATRSGSADVTCSATIAMSSRGFSAPPTAASWSRQAMSCGDASAASASSARRCEAVSVVVGAAASSTPSV